MFSAISIANIHRLIKAIHADGNENMWMVGLECFRCIVVKHCMPDHSTPLGTHEGFENIVNVKVLNTLGMATHSCEFCLS